MSSFFGYGFAMHLAGVLAPSIAGFTAAQAVSAVELMQRVAAVGGEPSALQLRLISEARSQLEQRSESPPKWS